MLLHRAAGKVAVAEDSATTKIQAVQRGKAERETLRTRGRAAWRDFRAEAADLAADPTMQAEAEAIFNSYAQPQARDGDGSGSGAGNGGKRVCRVAQADVGAVMAAITEELYGVVISVASLQFAAGIISSGSGGGGGSDAEQHEATVAFSPFYTRYAKLLASPLVAGAAGWAKPAPQQPTPTSRNNVSSADPVGAAASPTPSSAGNGTSMIPSDQITMDTIPTPPAMGGSGDADNDDEGTSALALASFELGSSLIAAQDYPGARTAFISALKLGHPTPARCRNGAGVSAALEGAQAEAIKQFTAALELDPADARTLHNRAQAYRASGKWKQAEADAKAAVAADGGGSVSDSARLAEETELEKAASMLQTLQR